MTGSNMNISVNGQSQVPPGFRFHPTEEELLQYYLKKKVSNLMIDLDVIRDVDLNKLEPWDIQEKCRIGTTPQNDWYFFSHKDKKYPTGTRTNRATAAGFWKATGRDKVIYSNCKRIGMRKTLVFYKGRAPHGQKSDWIMHEYRLDDNTTETISSAVMIETTQEEGWVVCRIFKKKNHQKTLGDDHDSPVISSATSAVVETRNNELMSISMFHESGDEQEGALEQIFRCTRRRPCKEETNNDNNNKNTRFLLLNSGTDLNGSISNSDERFLKLPRLESPNSTATQNCHQTLMNNGEIVVVNAHQNNLLGFHHDHNDQMEMITNWTALDSLVASHLNGQAPYFTTSTTGTTTTTVNYPVNDNHDDYDHDLLPVPHALRSSSPSDNNFIKPNNYYAVANKDYSNEVELWSFARSASSSSSDPMCHMSNAPL